MFSSLFKTKKGKLTFWISLSVIFLIIASGIYYALVRADVISPLGFFDIPKGSTGHFGGLVVRVKDNKTKKAIPGATVSFVGTYDNDLFNKAPSMLIQPCSSQSLVTDVNGQASFTRTNKHHDLKTYTRADAPIKFKLPVIGSVEINAGGKSSCVYTITATPSAGSAYATYTNEISWPDTTPDNANLGPMTILLQQPMSIVLTSNVGQSAQVGQTIKLSWIVKDFNAGTVCTGSGNWSGKKNLDANGKGSQTITFKVPGSFVYALTCKKDGQSYAGPLAHISITVR